MVYNLKIENTPEYFANGLLVANCDCLRYGLFSHLKKRFNFKTIGPDGLINQEEDFINNTMTRLIMKNKFGR